MKALAEGKSQGCTVSPRGYCHGSEWLMGSETRAGDCSVMAAELCPWVCCTLHKSCILLNYVCIFSGDCKGRTKYKTYTQTNTLQMQVVNVLDLCVVYGCKHTVRMHKKQLSQLSFLKMLTDVPSFVEVLND